MANVSVRSTATSTHDSAATLSVAAPTGTVAGDIVIVGAYRHTPGGSDQIVDNNGATGFTRDRIDDSAFLAGEDMALGIFSRRIQSGDPSSYSFTFSGDLTPTYFSLVAITLANPSLATIYDVSPIGGTLERAESDGGTYDSKAVTSSIANDIHIIMTCREGGIHSNTPSGYTQTNTSLACFGSLRGLYKIISSATSTGTQTITADASGTHMCQSFLIKNGSVAAYTITAAGGSYVRTGVDTTLRLGAYTWLRHRK